MSSWSLLGRPALKLDFREKLSRVVTLGEHKIEYPTTIDASRFDVYVAEVTTSTQCYQPNLSEEGGASGRDVYHW